MLPLHKDYIFISKDRHCYRPYSTIIALYRKQDYSYTRYTGCSFSAIFLVATASQLYTTLLRPFPHKRTREIKRSRRTLPVE